MFNASPWAKTITRLADESFTAWILGGTAWMT